MGDEGYQRQKERNPRGVRPPWGHAGSERDGGRFVLGWSQVSQRLRGRHGSEFKRAARGGHGGGRGGERRGRGATAWRARQERSGPVQRGVWHALPEQLSPSRSSGWGADSIAGEDQAARRPDFCGRMRGFGEGRRLVNPGGMRAPGGGMAARRPPRQEGLEGGRNESSVESRRVLGRKWESKTAGLRGIPRWGRGAGELEAVLSGRGAKRVSQQESELRKRTAVAKADEPCQRQLEGDTGFFPIFCWTSKSTTDRVTNIDLVLLAVLVLRGARGNFCPTFRLSFFFSGGRAWHVLWFEPAVGSGSR